MTAVAERIEGFDLLRAAAIFGVVWIHGCDTSVWALRASGLAGAAVPLFVLASFFLMQHAALRHPEEGAGAVLRKRLARLLPPYLFWSAAYVVVRAAKHAVTAGAAPLDVDWPAVVLLGGASYQLYFIAALMYWSGLFLPAVLWCGRCARGRGLAAWALAAAGLALLWAGKRIAADLELAPAHSLFVHALGLTGFVPLGLALALGRWRWPFDAPRRRALSALAAVVAAAVAFGPLPSAWRPAPLALALTVWAIYRDGGPMPEWVRRISTVSYGIFFVHGFFVEGLQTIAGAAGWPLDSAFAAVAVIGLAFGASWATCAALYRAPGLRKWVS